MRNCLAIIGLVIVLAIIGLGILYFTGNLFEPAPANIPTVQVVEPVPGEDTVIERTNPLPDLPAPTPLPTATPLPDPVAYRTEVLLRVQHFGATLDAFRELNTRVEADPAFLNDPQWQTEMRTVLDLFVTDAQALGRVGPVPEEYAPIHGWLELVGPEAEMLAENYRLGLETGDQQYLAAAGENLARIREALIQAENAMLAAGWTP